MGFYKHTFQFNNLLETLKLPTSAELLVGLKEVVYLPSNYGTYRWTMNTAHMGSKAGGSKLLAQYTKTLGRLDTSWPLSSRPHHRPNPTLARNWKTLLASFQLKRQLQDDATIKVGGL